MTSSWFSSLRIACHCSHSPQMQEEQGKCNVFHVSNHAVCHEDVWRNGALVPYNPNLNTWWRWMSAWWCSCFTTVRSSHYPLCGRLDDPRTSLGDVGKRKVSVELWFPVHLACNPVTVLTNLYWLMQEAKSIKIILVFRWEIWQHNPSVGSCSAEGCSGSRKNS